MLGVEREDGEGGPRPAVARSVRGTSTGGARGMCGSPKTSSPRRMIGRRKKRREKGRKKRKGTSIGESNRDRLIWTSHGREAGEQDGGGAR